MGIEFSQRCLGHILQSRPGSLSYMASSAYSVEYIFNVPENQSRLISTISVTVTTVTVDSVNIVFVMLG